MLAQATNPAVGGTATPTGDNPTGAMLKRVSIIVAMAVVFYLLLIRPQSKKAKEQAAMLQTVKPGDKVVTSSGIVGTVVAVKDKTLSLRSADTKLEVLKSAVSEITDRSGDSTATAD